MGLGFWNDVVFSAMTVSEFSLSFFSLINLFPRNRGILDTIPYKETV